MIFFVFLGFLVSCSSFELDEKIDISDKSTFIQTEEAGTYQVNRQSGFNKEKKFVVKSETSVVQSSNKVVEKSITISERVTIKKVDLLRPKTSETIYYLNDAKYLTRLEMDYEKKNIKIIMKSPEDQWNGEKSFTIPNGNGNFCFYQNIVECMITSNFFSTAVEKEYGEMNFMLIWEGYPYFHEQYLNLPAVPITDATITYDGKNNKAHRFVLTAGGQSQFLMIDNSGKLTSHYWSSQGFSRVRR